MVNRDVQAIGELANLPIGDMLRSIALGIADAQFSLDKASMTVAELMSGTRMLRDLDTGELIGGDNQPTDKPAVIDSRVYFGFHYEDGERVPDKLSFLELGFVPTFYQFVDTVIEIKVAASITRVERVEARTAGTADTGAGARELYKGSTDIEFKTTPVNAAYSSSYNFAAELASTVRTKLVPVPPPVTLEERIRDLMDRENDLRERQLAEQRAALDARESEVEAEAGRLQEDAAARRQITVVDVHVAETAERDLTLIVDQVIGEARSRVGRYSITTMPGKADETAAALLDKLNRSTKLQDVAEVARDGDKLTFRFKTLDRFEVSQANETTANYFEFTQVQP